MKKISTIIALVLIITVTSVYAAWSYSQGASAGAEVTREINMAQVTTSGNKGTISVVPNNFAFLVDDLNEKDYIAELVSTGSLTVNFTPSAGADASLATTGIPMKATITVKTAGSNLTYTGVDANGNTVTVTPIKEKANNEITLTGQGVGTPVTELTAEQVLSALEFCVDTTSNTPVGLKLPTKADNDNFHNILKNYTIQINITEVVSG